MPAWRLSLAIIVSTGVTFFAISGLQPAYAAYAISMVNIVLFIVVAR